MESLGGNFESEMEQEQQEHKGEHRHHHHLSPGSAGARRLKIVLGLTVLYMLAEAIGGVLSNSLALMSDAGHMLTDVAALSLAILSLWFANRPATHQKTYGYYRMEILAALANGVALIVISLLIFYEAAHRIQTPERVHGLGVIIVGAGGLIVNGISALLLRGAAHENLNMRGAFLHVASDALGSIGALTAGILILWKHMLAADPFIGIAIGILIIYSSWRLIKEAVNILLEGTPAHIDIPALIAAMQSVPEVGEVHDLHVWTISSGKDALSAHVTIIEGASHRRVLHDLQDLLRSDFNIGHLTIQVESADESADDAQRLYQILKRSEPPPDATGAGRSSQGTTTRNG